jgi:hypothetical protein
VLHCCRSNHRKRLLPSPHPRTPPPCATAGSRAAARSRPCPACAPPTVPFQRTRGPGHEQRLLLPGPGPCTTSQNVLASTLPSHQHRAYGGPGDPRQGSACHVTGLAVACRRVVLVVHGTWPPRPCRWALGPTAPTT